MMDVFWKLSFIIRPNTAGQFLETDQRLFLPVTEWRTLIHPVLHESIKLLNHLVASVWLYVPFAWRVCDLAEPRLSSNQLRIHTVVGDDVQVVPPTVEEIVVPVVVHPHFD